MRRARHLGRTSAVLGECSTASVGLPVQRTGTITALKCQCTENYCSTSITSTMVVLET